MSSLGKIATLKLIKLYQKAKPLRTMIGKLFFLPESTCRFLPTCSDYMYEAVQKYGIFKGVSLGIRRIIRCNPLSIPAHDPVP